jgi:hypothetical protein
MRCPSWTAANVATEHIGIPVYISGTIDNVGVSMKSSMPVTLFIASIILTQKKALGF